MTRLIILVLLVYSTILCYSQNLESLIRINRKLSESAYEFEVNRDSLLSWEFNYIDSKGNNDGKIGELIFQRSNFVKDSIMGDSLLPRILFSIYPVSNLDSIYQFEKSRIMAISCCYPVCGATIIKTRNFVLYSDPFEINSAFNCSGVDYTRWNVKNILKHIIDNEYVSLKDLLKEIPIMINENIQ